VKDILSRLFRKSEEKPESVDIPTVPIKKTAGDQEATKPLRQRASFIRKDKPEKRFGLEPSQLLASCALSVGRQRQHNEDAIFAMTTTLASNGKQFPFGLYIVADGMGGHQHGEIASETAVLRTVESINKRLYSHIYSTNSHLPDEPLRDILYNSVQDAHNAILRHAPGGGTTLTCLVIIDKQMAIAHVGDSRVYAINLSGSMKALTRDHSLVRRLEELGQLTSEEAAFHPQRNVLYRALGQGEPFEPEVITAPTPESGYLLVCSDGLWGVVQEELLGNITKNSTNLYQACQEMVDAANEAGGPDNISVILIRLPD
jgi:serine/threonine protein phosphatase PrpC